MKKLISLLTAIVLVAALATVVFAAEDPALVVDTVEAKPGDEVVINIAIVNNPGITVGEFVIEYDKTVLEPVDTVADDPDDEDTLGVQSIVPVADWKWETIINENSGFVGMSASKGTLKGDCVMFTLTLKVKEGTLPGSYPVNVVVDYIGDDDADFILATEFAGAVNVLCTEHVAGDVVIENEVAATCSAEGSHDEVTYCIYCETEMTRKTVVDAKLPHTPADAVIESEVAGDCQHKATYEEVVYCSVCNEEISRETKEGEYGEHVAGEAKKENVENADCQTKGSYDLVVRCEVCNEVLSTEHVEGEYGDHVAGEVKIENVVEGTDCLTHGTYDEVTYCTICGEELSRVTKEGEVGEHGEVEYVDAKDGQTHNCVCKVCGLVLDNEDHTYGEENVDTENKVKIKVCEKCGYEHREDLDVPPMGENAMIAVAAATLAMMGIAVVVSKKKEF